MISEDQYRFYKFCLELGNLKSERQKVYFSKAIKEYENEIEEENNRFEEMYDEGFLLWDFVELGFLGMILGAGVNYLVSF